MSFGAIHVLSSLLWKFLSFSPFSPILGSVWFASACLYLAPKKACILLEMQLSPAVGGICSKSDHRWWSTWCWTGRTLPQLRELWMWRDECGVIVSDREKAPFQVYHTSSSFQNCVTWPNCHFIWVSSLNCGSGETGLKLVHYLRTHHWDEVNIGKHCHTLFCMLSRCSMY